MACSLDNYVVVNAFFEPSTRTRLSFELAARRLGAQVVTLTEDSSSVRKGESLRDTALTLEAIGAHLVVLRHPEPGSASLVSDLLEIPVINAGDGSHDHPTQALVDAYTLRRHFGRIDGLRVVIAGDLLYGRGAHANAILLNTLGAELTFVAPRGLRPPAGQFPARLTSDFDGALRACDAVLLQRIQFERHRRMHILRQREFKRRYGLTASRAAQMPAHAIVLHPGPINRGWEIDGTVADGPRSLILSQVTNGVVVRAAVLRWALSPGATGPVSGPTETLR
jgi:aspartate carbamoyltransferase catalytic subunit